LTKNDEAHCEVKLTHRSKIMEELLLVNPRRRRARGKRKGRSAAQRAATRKMLAANRSRRSRRSAPSMLANPRRRRRRASARRYRRNPAALSLGRFGTIGTQAPMRIIQNAAIGAVGAIALNAVLSRLPLPMMLMTGRTRYLTQGVAALGLGMLAANFKIVGAPIAAQAAEGALTVTLADAIKDFAAAAGFPLAGMGYYLPGVGVRAAPNAGASPAMHMGKYVSGPGSGNVSPIRRTMGAMKAFSF
jgi:hypothetical protein